MLSFSISLRTSHQRLASILVVILLFSVSFPFQSTSAALTSSMLQVGQISTLPEPGKAIERELAGGQSHSYRLTLRAGQLFKVVVEQRGVDVIVMLFDSTGNKLAEVDSPNGIQGPEPLSKIAESTGEHRLEVKAAEADAQPGRYEIKVVELRQANEQDRELESATRLFNDALRLGDAGKYAEAVTAAERALAIREKVLGTDHLDVSELLNELAKLYYRRGEYAKAESVFRRTLAISEKLLGEQHLEVARPLNNLAFIYQLRGEYKSAEPLFLRALAIREKVLGPQHPDVAISLTNLAGLHHTQGDYVRAEPLYQRALGIREKTLNAQHPDLALSLHNLAFLYQTKGDYARAEPLYRRALEINEKSLGANHLDLTVSLNNLASVYQALGKYELAEGLYQRALTIREKVLGSEHPDVGVSLNNLAHFYQAQADYARAEPLYRRTVAMWEKVLGPEHPQLAYSVHNLASVYYRQGDYTRAAILYERALAIREKALSSRHPDLARTLYDLARLNQTLGQLARARDYLERAAEISEFNLSHNLISGSERQKLAYLALFAAETNQVLSFHAQAAASDTRALRLALATLLRRKGRTQDVITDTVNSLRRRADTQAQQLFESLTSARAQLANLTLSPSGTPADRARLKQAEEQVEKLEESLSARGVEFRAQFQPVTIESVQAALPRDALLVEFALYSTAESQTEQPSAVRYAAYALPPQGEPRWVDLGAAAPIDRAIAALRQALRDPQRTDAKRLARAVEEQVFRPIRRLLGDTRKVLLSPDGQLNLLPFAALVDEQNRWLVENYSFTYLSSGRDLLRLQGRQETQGAPLILANPAFGTLARAEQSAPPNGSEARTDFNRQFFPALAWTQLEATDLKALLPQAQVLLGAQATETALKRGRAPRLLHIATHGFFLQDTESLLANTRGLPAFSELRSANWVAKIENPLLRSGLALAGVNEHRSGEDDGVLTALEAASLDLWGTKLVVLSACDTGVGEVRNGEGVYGLRRALVLAGSETQVMSLWPVSDKETRSLMRGYYQRLLQGEGRGAALRQVQLEMLKRPQQHHPHYWASFIQAGEWANLDGKR